MLGYIAHALISRSAAIYENTVNAGSGGFPPRPLSEAFAEQFCRENEARLKHTQARRQPINAADVHIEGFARLFANRRR
jgi:hypothetical protein